MKPVYRYAEDGDGDSVSDYDGDDLGEVSTLNPMRRHASSGSGTNTDLRPADEDDKPGTVLSSYFNITNNLLGSCVLSLAYAFSQTGWVLGIILLVVCGASSAFALHILSLCAMKLNEREENNKETADQLVTGASFYSVAKACLPQFTIVIDLAIALKCFGVAISYFIVASDLMPLVAEHFGGSGVWVRRQVWVIISLCIVSPFCFLKDLTSLATFSSLSILFVGFFALLVCLYGSHADGFDPCERDDNAEVDQCKGKVEPVVMGMQALKALPIFVFGFTCHQNMFTVCNELKSITTSRVNRIIGGSIGTTLCAYLIIGNVGYMTFGSLVDSDILTSYPTNYFTSVARLFISMLVLLSLPVQCHPARCCVLTLIEQCTEVYKTRYDSRHGSGNSSFDGILSHQLLPSCPNDHDQELGKVIKGLKTSDDGVDKATIVNAKHRLFMIVTVCFLASTFMIAMSVSDLSVVLAFVGATGSTTVSYILPGFFYYYLFPHPEDGPVWKRNLALAQGISGLILMPLCLTFIFFL